MKNNRILKIGDIEISDESDCFVIAEIGHNHKGSLDIARDLFRTAKDCGAHAVKLQKRSNRNLYTKEFFNQPYDNRNSYGHTYGEHREALEFGEAEYRELMDLAEELGMVFMSTAFDFESADFLAKLGVPCIKVASADLNNSPLLKHIASIGKPMIVSTGGAEMADVERGHEILKSAGAQFGMLQCTAGYPAEFEELNLRVIDTFRQRFPDTVVGLSSHDNGIAMAVAAYVLGARIVEKHFTLNRAWKGTDHAFSLEPVGLRKLVRDLTRTRLALGDGEKRVYPSEVGPIGKMSKKIVAARPLSAGTTIAESDLILRSPGDGVLPYHFDDLIGKKLTRDLAEEEAVKLEDFSE